MKLRQIIIIGSAVLIIAGSVGLSIFLTTLKEEPEEKKEAPIRKYVKTTKVEYTDIDTKVVVFGRVKSAESLDLIAEISGIMTEGAITLKPGEKFTKGTLICIIDDTEAKFKLQAQKSNFLSDLAAILPDFKIDYPESFNIWQNYFNSIDLAKNLPLLPKRIDSKEKTFLATKNIFNSYYSIKSAEANMRKYKVYAPFNGSISEVVLQSGSYVNPGNKVARIIRTDKLELEVAIEVKDVAWLTEGTEVKIFSETGQQSWKGNIVRIGDLVNQNTQSIDVFISISPNQYRIYDGLYLRTEIPGKKVKNSMEIPRNAIFNGTQVFVVADTLLKVRDIQIHKINPQSVVFSGLGEGEDLVVEPLINAHNNMRVWKLSEKESSSTSVTLTANKS